MELIQCVDSHNQNFWTMRQRPSSSQSELPAEAPGGAVEDQLLAEEPPELQPPVGIIH